MAAEEEPDWDALFSDEAIFGDYMAAPIYPFNFYNSPMPFDKMIHKDSTVDELRTEIRRLEGLYKLYRRNQSYLGNAQNIAQQIRDEIDQINQQISLRFDENQQRNVLRKVTPIRENIGNLRRIIMSDRDLTDPILSRIKDYLGVKRKDPTNPDRMGRGLSYKGKKHGFIRKMLR